MPNLFTRSASGLRQVLRVVVAFALWGLITHSTFAGTGDEPHYLAIAHSIAFDFDLDVGNNYGAAEPLIAGGGLEPGMHVRTHPDGVVRPVHDVGMPALFAPAVRVLVPLVNWTTTHVPEEVLRRARLTPTVLYRHTLSLVMIWLATLLAGLLFDALIGAGASSGQAFGLALIAMLSIPLLILSILFFTELLSALLCFYAFQRIVWKDLRGICAWSLTGAAAGALMIVHARNAGLVIALGLLGVAVAWRRGARRDAGAFAAAAGALLGIRTIVNARFWGTLVTNSHASLGEWTGWRPFADEIVTRLAGLLVDQEFGLLIYAPIYGLAIVGLLTMRRTDGPTALHATGSSDAATDEMWLMRRDSAGPIVFVAGCYLALVLCPLTNVQGWTGGWSPPARFLTPIVPLLVVPLYRALRIVPKPVLILLFAAQIGIDAVMWQIPKLAWNDGDGRAAFCERFGDGVCRVLPALAVSSGQR